MQIPKCNKTSFSVLLMNLPLTTNQFKHQKATGSNDFNLKTLATPDVRCGPLMIAEVRYKHTSAALG